MSRQKRSKSVWVILMSVVLVATACGGSGGGSGGCPVDGDPGTQQLIGGYVTQFTANQRRDEYQEDGCDVSNGIFPCWPDGVRAYCFNVFF